MATENKRRIEEERITLPGSLIDHDCAAVVATRRATESRWWVLLVCVSAGPEKRREIKRRVVETLRSIGASKRRKMLSDVHRQRTARLNRLYTPSQEKQNKEKET